ncbi:MAG: TRAP transporter substrate-binding protein [Candidatus Limiplasma sp.]|nr:TRAP transporter substrate-binding protein [Candidatus Limiplasma sp.]
MKKCIALILALVLLASCSLALAEESRTLTFSHVFATDHPVHIAVTEANELLKEKTNGRLQLEIYPNSTFANYNDSITAVQMGTVDFACLDSAANWLNKAGVLLGPYVFRSYDHWQNFKSADFYPALKAEIGEAVGVHQFDHYNFGFRHLTANKEIRTLADFKGLVLRCVDFPPYSELKTIFDVNITAIPIGDVYMSLQTGVADCEENPVTQIVTMKFYEVQKYLMLTKHMLAISGTVMSKSAWDSLSAEDQAIVEEVFSLEAARIDELVVQNEENLIQQCIDSGMTVLRDVDTTPFQERVPLVLENYPDWIELYQQIQDLEG